MDDGTDKIDRERFSEQELDIVLETVCEMIIKGLSRRQIISFLREKDINKSIARIDVYIAKAKQKIKEDFSDEAPQLIALAAKRYEDLYQKNYQIQDYRECRQVQDSFNKLAGLYEKDNEQKKTSVNVNLTDKEVKEISDKLEDEL